MKITKAKLRQILKEEIASVLSEQDAPRDLSSQEIDDMYDEIMDERGVDLDFVNWTSILFITPDGRGVAAESDGGVRGEDHRIIAGYLPDDIAEFFDTRSRTEAMNYLMEETGLARLVYMGYNFAAIDYETPLTKSQMQALENFAEQAEITRLEFHPPEGDMFVVDPREGLEPPRFVDVVVVAEETWRGEVDLNNVVKIFWDTDDTDEAEKWTLQNSSKVRDEVNDDVAAIATIKTTEDAYDLYPTEWQIEDMEHDQIELPDVES